MAISRTSMQRILSTAFAALSILLLFAGCTLPWKHSRVTPGAQPTAQQLLNDLQKSFATVTTFHVVMQVQNPGPSAAGIVQIRSANGDVIMPDKVKAQATVTLSGQAVAVNLISIGNQQFITDPITGQWRVIKGILDPRTLTNPKTGLISVIAKVQNVGQPVADTVGNTACWRIKGQLDAKYLAFFTGGGVPAGTMLQTSACIGKADALPYQVIVSGRAAAGDTAQTSRTFLLSNYNESLQITAPQV